MPTASSTRSSAYGIYFGIQEGEFAADRIAKLLSGEIRTDGNPFADFERLCDEGNDVVEDVIGVLWDFPLAFQRIFTWRDRVPSLDLLSGRIYGEMGATNPARIAVRRLMASKERAGQNAKAASSSESAEVAAASRLNLRVVEGTPHLRRRRAGFRSQSQRCLVV